MDKLQQIIKKVISESKITLSEKNYSEYSEYLVTYNNGDSQYVTTRYDKAMNYIHDNDLEDYTLEGKKLGKWEVID